MTQANVLLSGGLDSTTLLAQACDEFGKDNVRALSINYDQRHKDSELVAAKLVAQHFGVRHVIRRITIGIGGLSDENVEVPNVPYSELQGVSPTYVPFRNGLLLATITSFASEGLEYSSVMEDILVGYGAHAEDAANWAYPDCTPEFIGAMASAIYVGTYHKVRLWTPLMWMTKAEIIQLGDALGVPWEITWSCYQGGDVQCGICSTCRARRAGFEALGIKDPTQYQE